METDHNRKDEMGEHLSKLGRTWNFLVLKGRYSGCGEMERVILRLTENNMNLVCPWLRKTKEGTGWDHIRWNHKKLQMTGQEMVNGTAW